MSIHTAKNISHCASRAKLGIGHYRYALVNFLIESDFVIFNRRIFVTKITVSNISNGLIMSYIEKNVFC